MSFYTEPPLPPAASTALVRFGRRTRPVETNPAATTVASRAVQNNPNRVEFTIVNLGTQNVYLSLSNQVSSTNGIIIPPNGGITVLVDEDGEVVTYDWYVVTTSGSQSLYVQEEVAD